MLQPRSDLEPAMSTANDEHFGISIRELALCGPLPVPCSVACAEIAAFGPELVVTLQAI